MIYSPCPGNVPGLRGGYVSSASDSLKKPPKRKGGITKRTGETVGDALRDAYEQAVSEEIPSEMLDLLKKLD